MPRINTTYKNKDSQKIIRKEEALELAGRLELLRLSLDTDSVHVILIWKREGFEILSAEQSRQNDSVEERQEEPEQDSSFVDELLRNDRKHHKVGELHKRDSYFG